MARVLLVEDDAVIITAVTMVLEGEGYTVIPKQRGADAIAHSEPADIVLLDLTLPDIAGEEVCRQLKGRGAPIILMSGRENLRSIARESGADDYIDKPFDINVLLAKIGEHLARAEETRQA